MSIVAGAGAIRMSIRNSCVISIYNGKNITTKD